MKYSKDNISPFTRCDKTISRMSTLIHIHATQFLNEVVAAAPCEESNDTYYLLQSQSERGLKIRRCSSEHIPAKKDLITPYTIYLLIRVCISRSRSSSSVVTGQKTARYNLVIKYFSIKSNNVSFVSCDIPTMEAKMMSLLVHA